MDVSENASSWTVRRGRRPHGTSRNFMHENRETSGTPAVGYADDTILGFQYQTVADRFLENLRERLAKFGLGLHSDKTRRIEFGRFE